MFHGALTLLNRSLRLDARLRSAHAVRFASALIAFGMLVIAHINTGGLGAPGREFFKLLCGLGLGLISIAGLGFFSSTITQEKEEGTLPLLILADISAMGILIGKSTTRLLSALILFSGVFPFALLALALGGITFYQIFCGLLSLAAYLVLVANLGLLASVICRTTARASIVTLLAVLVVLFTPQVAQALAAAVVKAGWETPTGPGVAAIDRIGKAFDRISPVSWFSRIIETGFSDTAWSPQVLGHLGASAVLLAVAGILFRRSCEYLEDDSPRHVLGLRVETSRQPAAGRRSSWRRLLTPRPWRQALIWKDFCFIAGGWPGLAIRAAMIPAGAALLFATGQLTPILTGMTIGDAIRAGILLVIGLESLAIAARIFHVEYRAGTLCTLVLLPRSTRSLCLSKLAGCLLALVPAAVWFLVSAVVLPINEAAFADIILMRPTAFIILAVALMLMHLTACLSLVMKWGALPASLMLMLTLSVVAREYLSLAASVLTAATGAKNPVLTPTLYLCFIACGGLEIAIGVRFRQAAAD